MLESSLGLSEVFLLVINWDEIRGLTIAFWVGNYIGIGWGFWELKPRFSWEIATDCSLVIMKGFKA